MKEVGSIVGNEYSVATTEVGIFEVANGEALAGREGALDMGRTSTFATGKSV